MGTKYLLVTLVIALVAGLFGFAVGRNYVQNYPSSSTANTKSSVSAPQTNTLFTSQTATIQGKITSVNGTTINVATDKGQSGQFTASPKMGIYKYAPGATQTNATQDLKAIETNKTAVIQLTLVGSAYQINSISYIPTTPPPAIKK